MEKTCIYFCLSSSEWASWSQAILSMVAILSTIYVMREQNKLRKQEKEAEKDEGINKAIFYSVGILSNINQITGSLYSSHDLIEKIINDHSDVEDYRLMQYIIGNMNFPEKEDLVYLNSVLPKCAADLLRIKNVSQQIKQTFKILENSGAKQILLEDLIGMSNFLSESSIIMKEIGDELDKFVPH